MTREETVKRFKTWAQQTIGNHCSDEDVQMFENIFTLLAQGLCEDCISRLDTLIVMEIMMDDATVGDGDNDYATLDDLKQQYIEIVKGMSPVTPKQKSGHWIKYGIPRCGEQHYKCTSCGYYINFGQWGELYTKEFKYCPSCGAKMEKREEED